MVSLPDLDHTTPSKITVQDSTLALESFQLTTLQKQQHTRYRMVQAGPHQAALGSSTNFRLLGQTHEARVFMRRNLVSVSGVPPTIHELHKDGVARDVDDFSLSETGMYPIENIIGERVVDGKTQYLVVWAGEWRPIDKYTWLDANRCQEYDIASWRVEKAAKACRLADIANGVTAENTPPTTSHTNPQSSRPRSVFSIQKRQSRRRRRAGLRPGQISNTRIAAINDALAIVAGNAGGLGEDSEDDGECEEIPLEEQRIYAARSTFGR